MQVSALFTVLAVLAGTFAAPVHTIDKRALPKLGGVNLAGCDFGMNTWGWAGVSYCPGTEQIGHFTSKGANLIRLPVAWQYLVGNKQASTSFDEAFFAKYDNLVKSSLAAGAYVMIDIHNYGRWESKVIGVDGPSNQEFANLWSNIAKRYASQDRIIFGIMNEPHDQDMSKWAVSVQAAVNAIRAAGATSQSIALPGDLYTHAEKWYEGTNDPVVRVTDPAGADKSKLIIDVHQYLDGDGSGQSRECVTNGIDKLTKLAAWLKANNRRALVSETGGGNTASCQQNLGEYLKFISTNDAFVGFAVWSAGSFDASYELSITPQNGQDNDLFKKAVQPYLPGAGGPPAPVVVPSSTVKPSTAPTTVAPTTAPTTVKPTTAPTTAPTTVRPTTSSTTSPKPTVAPTTSSSTSPKPTVVPTTAPTTSSKPTVAPTTAPTTSPKPTVAPTTAPTTSPKPTVAPTTAPAPASATGNLQKYTGTLGGPAPAVTKSGNGYITGSRSFNFLNDALAGSCYIQMDTCQNAANRGGNKAPLTVDACNTQIQACLKVASA